MKKFLMSDQEAPEQMKNRLFLEFAAISGIILLAAALRFYKLGEWSFWVDELSMVERARNFSTIGLFYKSTTLALMNIALTVLGLSEASSRLVPALIGVVSIPVLYFLIRKIFQPGVALAAMLLLAISPWHVYWSQNARFYTTLLLFCSLSVFLFYLGIEKDRPSYLLLSMVFLGLAFFERHIALFMAPVVAGYLVLVKILPFEKPLGLRLKNVGVLSLPALAAVPVAAPVFLSMTSGFVESYTDLARNSPFWILGGSIYYLGIPILVIGCLGLYYLYIQKQRAFLLLGLGAVVPMVATAVLSLFTYTANRYVFVSLVFWILLASIGAVELIKQTRGATRLLASGILLLLVVLPMSENAMYYFYQHGNRANWKAATELVKRRKEAGDQVASSSRTVAEYYLSENVTAFNRLDTETVAAGQSTVWFIEDMVGEAYWPKVHRWIVKNANLVEVFDVQVEARNFKMRVYRYDPASP